MSPKFSLFKRSSKQVLGVDIGNDNIKAVLLKNVKGEPFIDGFALSPTPQGLLNKDGVVVNPDTLAEALKIITSAYDLRVSRAIVALNSNLVRTIEITIPDVPNEQIEEMVKWEAAKVLDYPIEESSWDYQFLGSVDINGKIHKKGLFVAVPLTLIDPIIRGFSKANLKLEAIELDAYAEARTLRFMPGFKEDMVYLMLNIGASSSMLNLFSQGRVLFSRAIHFGGDTVTNIIREEFNFNQLEAEKYKKEENFLNVDSEENKELRERVLEILEENLFSEIHRAVAFTQQEWRQFIPESKLVLILSGGGSALKGLREVMEENLGFKTLHNNSLLQVSIKKTLDKKLIRDSAQLFNCAFGLGLRLCCEVTNNV